MCVFLCESPIRLLLATSNVWGIEKAALELHNRCSLYHHRLHETTDDMIILADLTDQYQFPPSLAPSDLWPVLVAYSDLTRTVIIIELTACFETNFKRCRNTVNLLRRWKVMTLSWDLIIVEVGLRILLMSQTCSWCF